MLGSRMNSFRRLAELNVTMGFSTASSRLAPDKLFKKIDIELRYVILSQSLTLDTLTPYLNVTAAVLFKTTSQGP